MQIERKLRNIFRKVNKLPTYFNKTIKEAEIKAHDRIAVVNLSSNILNKDMGRYSFIICQMLKFSGFQLAVKVDLNFFVQEAPYKKMLLSQGYTFVRNTGLPPDTIALYVPGQGQKLISLKYGFQLIADRLDAYYLPYTLHPRFYRDPAEAVNFDKYRSTERTTRIIFSGNFDRELYSKSVLKEKFPGTISRIEVLDHIAAKHSSDPRILRSASKEALYERLETKPLAQEFIISEARTPDEDWLSILSKGDFYLCLPGVRMPWSHNAIESMALGTIPILQYNELFHPPLEHLKNCIAYNSYESLDEALETALSMSEEAVQSMRAEVILYHDRYLSTAQTVEKIQAFAGSEEDQMLVALPFLTKGR